MFDCYHQHIQKEFETTKLYEKLPLKYTKVGYWKDIQMIVRDNIMAL